MVVVFSRTYARSGKKGKNGSAMFNLSLAFSKALRLIHMSDEHLKWLYAKILKGHSS